MANDCIFLRYGMGKRVQQSGALSNAGFHSKRDSIFLK